MAIIIPQAQTPPLDGPQPYLLRAPQDQFTDVGGFPVKPAAAVV